MSKVGSFFGQNGKGFKALGYAWDLIVLNILLVVCSIPIFTAGASITATADMCMRLQRKEEGYIIQGFFRAFRSNFKNAVKIWMLFLLVMGICIIDVGASKYFEMPLLQLPVMAVGLVAVLVVQYALLLQARFENTCMGTIKNALILTVARLPVTMGMILVTAVPFLMVMYAGRFRPSVITLCILLLFALVIDIHCRLIRSTFAIWDEEK